MASFDISVDEFLSECSVSERKEIIVAMVEDGFLPNWIINKEGKIVNESSKTNMEFNFIQNLEKLKTKYYSLSKDDENVLEQLFKNYL